MGQIDWAYSIGALLILIVVGPFPLWAVWHDARQSEKMKGKDMWFVIVEDAKGQRHHRAMAAKDADQAGRLVCALIGGPNASAYRVIRSVPV